jgi:hypothetical protein
MGAWIVIRTLFECPETGEPLPSTVTVGRWPAGEGELVARHCSKCGKLHRFEPADAILLFEAGERAPRAIRALSG